MLTIPDHLVASVSPFAGATAAAVATTRLHTGTLVLNNDLRHPVDTAGKPPPSLRSPAAGSNWASAPVT